jgi:two-component system sensor histidine kinase KdpD
MKGPFTGVREKEAVSARPGAARRLLAQVALGSLGVATVTAACFFSHLDFQVSGFLYLIVVVLVSLSGGYASAAIVSIVAASCLEYFLIPPVLTWRINSPQDLLALISYLVTSLVITRLASSARNQTLLAETKRKDMARLYETASRLLSLEPEFAASTHALRIFREGFGLDAVCLFDSTTASEQVDGDPEYGLIQETRNVFAGGRDYRNPGGRVNIHCLYVDGKPAGAVGFEGRFEDEDAVGPLFALAATTFERALSFRSASAATTAAQAEMLRSAILDAFAHEFKTPQAVIMAAAGSLRETGGLRTEQAEMADVIEGEVSRMSRLTTRLLRMARIDRDEVKPNMEVICLDSLLSNFVQQYRGVAGDRRISMKLHRDSPEVLLDQELMNLAFVQLLDNACKYSTPGTGVTVEIDCDGRFADTFVTNDGGFIREDEQERVFERFYRGAETEYASSGAGLGLFVARKIIRAHEGSLELYRNQTKSGTTTFRMRLPVFQGDLQIHEPKKEELTK